MAKYKELKRKTDSNLEPEARTISISITFKIITGHPVFAIGAIFFALSVIMLAVFGSLINFNDYRFKSDSPVTMGVVQQINPTNTKVNKVTVYQNIFEYTLSSNLKQTSSSYTIGKTYSVNDTSKVTYLASDPKIARIENSTLSMVEAWVLLILAPFFLVGFFMLFFHIKSAVKNLKILKYGKLTTGTLIHKEPTNVQINKRTVYKLTFEFSDSFNNKYQAIAKSHIPEKLTDEAQEQLVYLPDNPEKAVLLDSLPSSVKQYMNTNFQ